MTYTLFSVNECFSVKIERLTFVEMFNSGKEVVYHWPYRILM